MHPYRTHTCGALRKADAETLVKLSGWVHRKRDHGGVIFIDLRDHYGLTQVVVNPDAPFFADVEKVRNESVVTFTGTVVKRTDDTVNPNMDTGEIEVVAEEYLLESLVEETLPFTVNQELECPEETRLGYRFLDLRRDRIHRRRARPGARTRVCSQGG